jgi:hypothetical protein
MLCLLWSLRLAAISSEDNSSPIEPKVLYNINFLLIEGLTLVEYWISIHLAKGSLFFVEGFDVCLV